MTTTIDFMIDFASPNSYMANKVLPEIAARTGASINYIPVLLGGIFKATNNQAPWMMYSKVAARIDYDRLEIMRFLKKHKLDKFQMNKHFPLNSLMMMRGAVAAQRDGQLEQYVAAAETAMWEENRNMAEPEQFVAAMNGHGLDGDALLAKTQDPQIKAKLIANTEDAISRKVFGVPTFFVGEEMFFGKERLGQLEEAVQTLR